MRHLIKKAKIIAQNSTLDGKRMDILVVNGVIAEIAKSIKDPKAKLIESANLNVSIGWMDIGTHIGEPGHEQRETMSTLCNAALAGGYTDIATFPNAAPTIQTKPQIISLISDGKQHGVDIHPVGALSVDTKGENIAEYIDMGQAGAVAYSDGLKSIQKSGLLLRALQYAKGKDGLVIHHPTDYSIDNDGLLHEGMSSIKMGMKGSPDMAEHLMVTRDIELAQYAETKLCLHAISCKASVDKVKKAKSQSEELFATVSYLNLISNDEDMLDFDSNYKVKPVLRGEADRKALVAGAKSGVIDIICSNHVPLEPEVKFLEFSYAKFGATGLETAYAAMNTHLKGGLASDDMVRAMAVNPRKMLGIDVPEIKVDAVAKLTCWDDSLTWTYDGKCKKSKSSNNPFFDSELTGRVVATINGKAVYKS